MQVAETMGIEQICQVELLYLYNKRWQVQSMHASLQVDTAQPSHPS